MRILEANTRDHPGGAAQVAVDLLAGYRDRGHEAWLAAGEVGGGIPHVLSLLEASSHRRVSSALEAMDGRLRGLPPSLHRQRQLRRWARWLMEPRRLLHLFAGREDWDFPGTWRLLTLPPARPDILHAHNLHGNYFDLRVLPWLSRRVPLFLTLHDPWLLTGGCGHPMDCSAWRTGCLSCTRTFPWMRAGRAGNRYAKASLITGSRLHVATPCRWLMDMVQASPLRHGILDARVIPNGVDLSLFRPGSRKEARHRLGLPLDADILVMAANGFTQNPWRTRTALRDLVGYLGNGYQGSRLVFLAVGEEAPSFCAGRVELRFVPFQQRKKLLWYYQAADLHVHPSLADTFPNTVLEAAACGRPSVGSAVGGIPEQILHERTGILTPRDDPATMAGAILKLIQDPGRCREMGLEAAVRIAKEFSRDRQVERYLSWFSEVLERP